MTRKLVVCCDGTWNTPRQNTNIFKTYNFLRRCLGKEPAPPDAPREAYGVQTCASDDSEVLLFYDEGVGVAASEIEKQLFGATGTGLSGNVCDAYRFLANNFTPGSEIYLFGFSRGAYTARALCGFIKRTSGLLEEPTYGEVWRAYIDCYATEQSVIERPPGLDLAGVHDFLQRASYLTARKLLGDAVGRVGARNIADIPRRDGVRIQFLGVYDTVGALGVPLIGARDINEPIVGFYDTSLSDIVDYAVHALAVDERREPFTPTLWTHAQNATQADRLSVDSRVLQVWFPGVHSDIGGGYEDDTGIGDVALHFMLDQAARHGLELDPNQRLAAPNFQAPPAQHESFDAQWQGLAARYGGVDGTFVSTPRSIGRTVPDPRNPAGPPLDVAGEIRLHRLLVERFDQDVVTITDGNRSAPTRYVPAPPAVRPDTLPEFV